MKSPTRRSSPSALIPQHYLYFGCILICIFFTTFSSANGLHLTGVTVLPDHPRADTLSGFFTHLLDEVAQLGNFSYNLRVMPPATKHGGAVGEGTDPEGLVGLVYNDKADFAIADLEITTHRKSLLEFTRPFLQAKLAALVSRNRPKSPKFSSLQESDDQQVSSTEVEETNQPQTLRSVLLNSKRVLVRGSVVDDYFRTDKKAFRLMPTAVASLKEAVALLSNDSEIAVVGDSARLSLLAANDCDLEVITPVSEVDGNVSTSEIGANFSVNFAVAFHDTNAGFLQFDVALEELEVSGRLAELIKTYWSGPCTRMRQEEQQDSAGFSDDTQENGVSQLISTLWWAALGALLPLILLLL